MAHGRYVLQKWKYLQNHTSVTKYLTKKASAKPFTKEFYFDCKSSIDC